MKKLAGILCAVLLAGCSEKGNEYIGKWENNEHGHREMVVERNGDLFFINTVEPSMFKKGETETRKLPASYKDGQLQVQNGFGAVVIAYQKDKDALLLPTMGGAGMEYKRTK